MSGVWSWATQKAGDYSSAATDRLARTAVALAKRGYAAYSGTCVEESIARALSQYLVLDIDLGSVKGPIRSSFRNVRFTPLVKHLVATQLDGLQIDLETTEISQLELEVDVEALLTGNTVELVVSEDGEASVGSGTALLEFCVGSLSLVTPGVRMVLKDLRIEVKAPESTGASGSQPSDQSKQPQHRSTALAALAKALTDPANEEEIPDKKPKHTGTSAGTSSYLVNYAADVVSNWILMGACVALDGVEFVARLDLLEDSPCATELSGSAHGIVIQHKSFFGSRRKQYEELNSSDKNQALLFHLFHLPFSLSLDYFEASLGDALEITMQAGGGVPALRLEVEHDDWTYFKIDAKLHAFQLRVGATKHRTLWLEPGGEGVELKFCSILQEIEGNVQALRRCYTEDIGADGARELSRLQRTKSELHARLDELLADGSHNEADVLEVRETLAVLSASMERFFENQFYLQAELIVTSPLGVEIDPQSLGNMLKLLSQYLLSWVATRFGSFDGDRVISPEEWQAAVGRQVLKGLDLDNDGLISDEEWAVVVHTDQLRELSLLELAAECIHQLKQCDESAAGNLTGLVGLFRELEHGKLGLDALKAVERVGRDIRSIETGDEAIAANLERLAALAEQSCRSLLLPKSQQNALGIQLNVQCAMPTIRYRPPDTASSLVLDLGDIVMECPARSDERGEAIPRGRAANNCMLIVSKGLECRVQQDEGASYPVLQTPTEIKGVVRWEAEDQSVVVRPSNLKSLSVDLFGVHPISGLSSEECITGQLCLQSRKTLIHAISGFHTDFLRGLGSSIHGFTLKQLRELLAGLMVHAVYRKWLLPPRDPNSSLHVQLRLHMVIELVLQVTSRYPALECRLAVPLLDVRGSNSFASCEKIRISLDGDAVRVLWGEARALLGVLQHDKGTGGVFGAMTVEEKVAVVESMAQEEKAAVVDCMSVHEKAAVVDSMASGTKVAEVESMSVEEKAAVVNRMTVAEKAGVVGLMTAEQKAAVADSMAFVPEGSEDPEHHSMAFLVEIPSKHSKPAEERSKFVDPTLIKGPKIRLVDWNGALDGITATVPSLCLRVDQTPELSTEFVLSAMQLRAEGLAATSILEQHYHSEINWAYYLLEQLNSTKQLTHFGQDTCTKSAARRVTQAIVAVRDQEVRKAEDTKTHQLWRVSLILGQLTMCSIERENREVWLNLFTEARDPLWSVYLSVASVSVLSNTKGWLQRSYDAHPCSECEELLRVVTQAAQEVQDAALDFHDLDLQGCCALVSITQSEVQGIPGLLGIIRHLLDAKHQILLLSKSNLTIRTHRLSIETVNLWPSSKQVPSAVASLCG
eukprot:TRINITY_DN2792_c0_g2_i10.p1 TRINITY_DN2792_c0_g2~~TRINITY_DN2792_c0_g2_i10.p1  ORF type:complete len:1328 (-),score=311.86 TRINITY_DN2792_c0_g2_i10:874-4857(-)